MCELTKMVAWMDLARVGIFETLRLRGARGKLLSVVRCPNF